MRRNLIAKRAFALGVMAALMAAFLVGPTPVTAAGTGTIVFDYSHGQYSSYLIDNVDLELKNNLTALGYTVVWALGGINASILEDATAFIAGSQYGETTGYTAAEYSAIAEWFNTGNKFMWVGYDSDYEGNSVITNMTTMLAGVNSHVYGEPLSIEDPESNCDAGYRAVANVTSTDPFVADIVADTAKVLMHGPTLLYGSTTGIPEVAADAVALETTTIANVYPFLYYSDAATIVNNDLIDGFAHSAGDVGGFVAATIETGAGAAGTGVIIVSGASPYGDYRPMHEDNYKDVVLTGYNLVPQGIDFGINTAQSAISMTLILAIGAIGAVVVVVVIVAMMKKK